MANLFAKLSLKAKLSPGIAALYSNIIIDQIGSGLIGLFLPIFLWEKFGSLNAVLLYYLVIYGAYILLVVAGAKMMSVLGQKLSMILSVPFKVVFYGCLYYLSLNYPALSLAILMIAACELHMMLFWIPYHTDFAKFTNKKSRGRVIGFLSALSGLVSVFIPIFAGWVIFRYNFSVLYLIALVLIATSVLPLFLVKPTNEKFTFSFGETWKRLFSKKYRRLFGCYFADGVESLVGAIIWPIFIFQLLDGNFLAVGAVSSLVILFTIVIQLLMGSFTDRFNKRKLMHLGSVFYALGWFFKIFVGTGFQIFIVSAYHNFAAIVLRTPFDALIYEKAADAGHYVDELSVLREIALNLGRVICLLVLFLLVNFIGLPATFVLAAVASLFVNLL